MIVIIIAAGQAKRLRPLTETRLKGSLPILNEALLLRMADMIEKSGIMEKLVLVVSPGQEAKMEELFSTKDYASKVNITIQDPPKGTADAAAKGEPFIGDTEQCLIMNGDILASLDEIIPKLIEHHEKLKAKCSMVVFPGKSARYGLLQLTDDGKVLEIKEKDQLVASSEEEGYINAGIYLFNREIFDIIRKTPLSSRGEYEITDSISILGSEGPIGAIVTNKWMSIENPIDLFNAQLFFSPTDDLTCMQFHSGGEIGFKAAEDIYFEADTEIEFSSVKFKGPVVVGQGTLIVSESEIGPRVFIGRNSEIGAKSTIKEALIMENVRIEEECNLTSIIIGEETLIGAKTTIKPFNLTKEIIHSLRNRDKLDDFVIIGGKSILMKNIVIEKGLKVASNSVITKEDIK